jgi:hypothetical protein
MVHRVAVHQQSCSVQCYDVQSKCHEVCSTGFSALSKALT